MLDFDLGDDSPPTGAIARAQMKRTQLAPAERTDIPPAIWLQQSSFRFRCLVEQALESCTLPRHHRTAIERRLGLIQPASPDYSTTAHWRDRQTAFLILRQLAQSLAEEEPRRRFFRLTAITDAGNALEYTPVLNRALVKQKLRRLIGSTELQSLSIMELQAVTNFPQGGHGGTLMLHANALAWTTDRDFDIHKPLDDISDKEANSTLFGAPAIRGTGVLHHQLDRICAYMVKAPNVGKRHHRSLVPKAPISSQRL